MIESANFDAASHWRVGQDEIELMQRQLGKQRIRLSFMTNHAHWLGDLKRRFQKSLRNKFRKNIGDADSKPERLAGWPPLKGVHEFAAQAKNLVSISKSQPAGLRKYQPATDTGKYLFAQTLLEGTDLRADGGLG